MSYLQQYVRQLKPRNESYTPPVEKIQSFLTEAKKSNFQLEDIWKRDNHKNFIDKIINGELLKSDGSKFPSLPADNELVNFLELLKDEPETGIGEHDVDGKKLDDRKYLFYLIKTYLGPTNTILKAENGFSGASGLTPKGEDWEALVVCGIRAHNENTFNEGPEWERVGKFWTDYGERAIELGKNMGDEFKIKDMEQWGSKKITTTPQWAPAKNKTPKTDLYVKSAGYKISLKKYGGSQLMSAGKDEAISTLDAAMVTYYGEDKKGREKIYTVMSKIQNKMGSMTEKGTITDLEKKIASGKPLSKKDAESAVEMSLANMNADEITKELTELFKDNNFKAHFCWEAATGQTKFGVNSGAAADNIITFKETGTISSRLVLDKPLGAGMTLAKGNNFFVSFKTGGSNSRAFLALRTKKVPKTDISSLNASYIPTFKDILAEELYKENLLTEANEHLLQLDEFALWNIIKKKAKGAASKILDASKRLYGAVMKRLTQAFDAIKRLGARMFNALLNFFDIKVTNVKVKGGGSYPLQ